jgi:NADPH:quinone reductase-like Zn-dependent oxidoreductase
MRAITVSEYGASPSIVELPRPQPGPGQVLIATQAVGMNPMDVQIANGGWKDRMPATFPMVLGADLAGAVQERGPGAIRFAPSDAVFGQLLIPPLGSAGTYAEYVAVSEDAPLARVPAGLDPVTAAALPTAGGTAMAIAESLAPLEGKTMLIVGAAGGVGSFLTQFAAGAGAHVDAAGVPADQAGRLKGYGAAETIDRAATPLPDAIALAHPDGIDVLIDLASDAQQFAALAGHVRPGGTAVTTRYVADRESLATAGVTGVNFQLPMAVSLLDRLAAAVMAGIIVPPPITQFSLDEVPALLSKHGRAEGKTVITM